MRAATAAEKRKASAGGSRAPSAKELEHHLAFIQKQREYQVAHATGSGSAEISPDLSALTDLAHVMMNANEFVYIN